MTSTGTTMKSATAAGGSTVSYRPGVEPDVSGLPFQPGPDLGVQRQHVHVGEVPAGLSDPGGAAAAVRLPGELDRAVRLVLAQPHPGAGAEPAGAHLVQGEPEALPLLGPAGRRTPRPTARPPRPARSAPVTAAGSSQPGPDPAGGERQRVLRRRGGRRLPRRPARPGRPRRPRPTPRRESTPTPVPPGTSAATTAVTDWVLEVPFVVSPFIAQRRLTAESSSTISTQSRPPAAASPRSTTSWARAVTGLPPAACSAPGCR